jgi:hypothetical protein
MKVVDPASIPKRANWNGRSLTDDAGRPVNYSACMPWGNASVAGMPAQGLPSKVPSLRDATRLEARHTPPK